MPRPQPQRALARRATPRERRWPEATRLRTGVVHVGLATLAVSVLGIGVAGWGLSTSVAAQDTHPVAHASAVVTTVSSGVKQPSSFRRDTTTVSRAAFREALTTTSKQSGELTASALAASAKEAAEPAQVDARALKARAVLLEKESDAAADRAAKLAKKKAAAKKAKAKAEAAAKKALGTSTMPMKKYSIAARFGDVGAWARYHTGFDFSAPIGTPIYAPTAGVVTHAGTGGDAAGWAGNYVVLEHADGTQSLYAHMSSISVQVGERVAGSTRIGQVGQTGRAFGPHLHFEIYPAGTTPGDVYQAVNPQPWLNKLSLKP